MLEALRTVISNIGLRTATITLFCMGFTFASTNPYISVVAINELGFSAQAFGTLIFVNSLVATFGIVLIGYFSDRAKNRKHAILVSFAVGALGFGIFAIWPSVFTFLLCLMVAAPISMSAFSQLYAVIRAFTNDQGKEEAAAINSLVRSIFAGSWILVPGLVGTYVAWTGHISDAFGIAALAYFFCLGLYFIFGPNGGRIEVPEETPLAGLKTAFKLIGSGAILSRLMSLALIGLAHPVNAALLPLIILEMDGGSTRDIGILAGLVAALEIPFMLLGGMLVKRIGILWVIIGGGILHAIYVGALTGVSSLTHIYALALLNAAGAAISLSLHISYLQDCMPSRPGLGTSLQALQTLIMRTLSAGVIAGIGLMFNFAGALAITTFAGFAGVALLIFANKQPLPETTT